jgi:hypothetical protein
VVGRLLNRAERWGGVGPVSGPELEEAMLSRNAKIIAVAAAAAFLATSVDLRMAAAAPAAKAPGLTTAGDMDFSAARKRRRGGGGNAAAFAAIAGTIGAIAIASQHRRRHNNYYGYYGGAPAYYGGPVYYGGAPAYGYNGGYGYAPRHYGYRGYGHGGYYGRGGHAAPPQQYIGPGVPSL